MTSGVFRGRFGLARAGYSAILAAFGIALLVGIGTWWISPWLLWLPFVLPAFVVFFFRDPERAPPTDPTALLAPADGTVDDLGTVVLCEGVEEGGEPYLRIGIYLSLLSVHVQRAPCAGTVLASFPIAGARVPTRRVGATDGNERHVTVIEPTVDANSRCMVRQIAGPIARGIVNVARPGQSLDAGERFGLIRFGSRVELFISAAIVERLHVQVGAPVRAGLTTLADFRPANEAAGPDVESRDLEHPHGNP